MSDTRIHPPALDPEDGPALHTRRGLLRRSALGVVAVGLAGFLAACGDDDDDPAVTSGQGAEGEVGGESGIEEETGIGDDEDAEETEEPEGTEEAEEDDD